VVQGISGAHVLRGCRNTGIVQAAHERRERTKRIKENSC